MATNQSDTSSADVDEQALTLRGEGRAFARIAEALGLPKSIDASRAFNRALRRRTAEEQAGIREQENSRLDRLASAVRANEALSVEETEKRLHTIERLRSHLMSD